MIKMKLSFDSDLNYHEITMPTDEHCAKAPAEVTDHSFPFVWHGGSSARFDPALMMLLASDSVSLRARSFINCLDIVVASN